MYQSFLSFQVLSSRNQIAVTVTSMMSGPNLSDLNRLYYHQVSEQR